LSIYKGVYILDAVIVILGPTASGKTKVSIELAKQINGEIVSADSMQIYKFMDIGTAKPDEMEREGVEHYLIDEVNPDEEFSVARYQETALGYIEKILSKGKTPIVVGGTGLYINSLLYNINYSETVSDWELRDQLKKESEEKGNEYLHKRLEDIDPEAAKRIHPNDIKRVIRAIEVYKFTNKPISYHQEISRQLPPKYRYIPIGLNIDREILYERINQRVDIMLEKGLVEEVKKLVEMGCDKNTIAMQAIGYKEILRYLRGETNLDEAVYVIKRDSRHYAKRQLTWFRRNQDIHWIDVGNCDSTEAVIENIKNYVASIGIFL